jgi:hypothetical protein
MLLRNQALGDVVICLMVDKIAPNTNLKGWNFGK